MQRKNALVAFVAGIMSINYRNQTRLSSLPAAGFGCASSVAVSEFLQKQQRVLKEKQGPHSST